MREKASSIASPKGNGDARKAVGVLSLLKQLP
jgi:hypothetical protein